MIDDGIYQAEVLSVSNGQSQAGNQQCRIQLRPVKIYLDGEDGQATDSVGDEDITAFLGFYNKKGALNIGNINQLRSAFNWEDGKLDSLEKFSGVVIKCRIEADKEGQSWVRTIGAVNQTLPMNIIPLTEKGKNEIEAKIAQLLVEQPNVTPPPKEDIPY